MRNIESRLQIACVNWFRMQYPRAAKLLNSVPNGGARNVVTGAIMKAEGAVRGVADLELNIARGGWFGLKIEMKTAKGKQSPYQIEWQKLVEAQGYRYIVARSIEDFMTQLNEYMSLPATIPKAYPSNFFG